MKRKALTLYRYDAMRFFVTGDDVRRYKQHLIGLGGRWSSDLDGVLFNRRRYFLAVSEFLAAGSGSDDDAILGFLSSLAAFAFIFSTVL